MTDGRKPGSEGIFLTGRTPSSSGDRPNPVGASSAEAAATLAGHMFEKMQLQINLTGTCDLAPFLKRYIELTAEIPGEARRTHPEFTALQSQLRDSVGVFGLSKLTNAYSSEAAKAKREEARPPQP